MNAVFVSYTCDETVVKDQLAFPFEKCFTRSFVFFFDIYQLISDVGYQDEIVRVTSACHQVDVFSRVLKTSIHSFLEDSDEFMQKRVEEFTVWYLGLAFI